MRGIGRRDDMCILLKLERRVVSAIPPSRSIKLPPVPTLYSIGLSSLAAGV